jgi:hypothetical protein
MIFQGVDQPSRDKFWRGGGWYCTRWSREAKKNATVGKERFGSMRTLYIGELNIGSIPSYHL